MRSLSGAQARPWLAAVLGAVVLLAAPGPLLDPAPAKGAKGHGQSGAKTNGWARPGHPGLGPQKGTGVAVPGVPAVVAPPLPVQRPEPAPAEAPVPPDARAPRGDTREPARPRREAPSPRRQAASRAPAPAPAPSPGPSPSGPPAQGAARDAVDTVARTAASAAGADRGRPRREDGGRRTRKPEGEPTGVERTVRDIVEVVPDPVKLALGLLGALTLLLGGGYLLLAGRARHLDRQRADLLQEVGLLQTALLPPVPGRVGAMRTSVAYRPSDGPAAGGDFYDAVELPGGRAAFILGDVSGHGRQALARTAFMRYTLRAYLEAGLEPRTTLQVAGRVVDDNLDGHFATVLVAVHDPSSGSLTFACAGHPAPIVVGPTRPEPILAASSPPIGLGMRTGLRQTTLPLPPGSVVCLYTDGLAEAKTEEGILGRPRLADIVAELGRSATADGLLDAVAAEAREVSDDMATLVLSPTAGMTAGGFRSELLEVDAEEMEDGLAERFLAACDLKTGRIREVAAEGRALASASGGAIFYVRFGIPGTQVEVLPRNVASLEGASRLRSVPRRSSA